MLLFLYIFKLNIHEPTVTLMQDGSGGFACVTQITALSHASRLKDLTRE